MQLSEHEKQQFLETVWQYYNRAGRHDLPWRLPEPDEMFDPYKILVSELMLQQTQVSRVIPKYNAFIERFPTAESLASASLADVLVAWQGLGYNRRAKFLWQAAAILKAWGNFPTDAMEITKLPGVGSNTAGAVVAYAFNQPVVFVETNVRTVYIHHFARDDQNISDTFIRDLVGQTLDREQPREFYWAIMDYGSNLKTLVRNNHQSKQYTKQSRFEGSRRQVRGAILRELGNVAQPFDMLRASISDDRLAAVLRELASEGLIHEKQGIYYLG